MMSAKNILHSLVQEFKFKKVHWSRHYLVSDEFAQSVYNRNSNPFDAKKYGKTSIDKTHLIIHFEDHNVYLKIKSCSCSGKLTDYIIYQVEPVEVKTIEFQETPETKYPEWFVPPYDFWEGIIPSACPQVGDKVSLKMCVSDRICEAVIEKVSIKDQRFYAKTSLGEDCGGMPFSWYRSNMGWKWA